MTTFHLFPQAEQVAEKVLSFVGRAFRHDIKSAFSSGVLTPEGADTQISATCEACATGPYRIVVLSTDRRGYDIRSVPRSQAHPARLARIRAPISRSSRDTGAGRSTAPDSRVRPRAARHHA